MSAAPDLLARRARVRVGFGAALVLVLVGLAVAVFVTAVTPRGAVAVAVPTDAPGDSAPTVAPVSTAAIYVHILGQVQRPGLYELHQGDRAIDAVAAAGGYTAKADPVSLNLARVLVDGEQIVVPVRGASAASGGASGSGLASTPGKVDLNTATEAELETLPRIGPAMAQRIIDWRTKNGRFRSVQDLLSVTGIGQKTLDGLKDQVTV